MKMAKIGNKTYKFDSNEDLLSALDIMNELQETLETKMNDEFIGFEYLKYPPCEGYYCDGVDNRE